MHRQRIPSQVRSLVSLSADQQPDLALCSDLDHAGRFAPSWLILHAGRLRTVSDGAVVFDRALDEITAVSIDELQGRARLLASIGDEEYGVIAWSADLYEEFAAGQRAIEAARSGKPILLPEIQPLRDLDDGTPLRERGRRRDRAAERRALLRALALLVPHRGRVLGLVALTLVSVAAAMLPPWCYKQITDSVLTAGRGDELLPWVLLMGGAFVVISLTRMAANATNAWLGIRVVADLRARMHAKLQQLPMSYHNRNESGELIGRVTHDASMLQNFLVDGLPWLLVNILTCIVVAGILFSMSPLLAIIVLAPAPLLIVGAGICHRLLRRLYQRVSLFNSRLHSHLGESIHGVKAVKAAVQEDARQHGFVAINDQVARSSFRGQGAWMLFSEQMALVMSAALVLVWYAGGHLVVDGAISIGVLVAFAGYMAQFYGPLQWFTSMFNWMARAAAGAERIFQLLDHDDEADDRPDDLPVPAGPVRLVFDRMHFSYERGREVLHDVSFSVEPGQMIGLVGRSGSGKSTLINLLCRFFEPDAGAILVDGTPLASLRRSEWRQHIGLVMQNPFLFDASILENIRYAKPEAADVEVIAAAKAAHAHEFILAKEDGYDTRVGERGVQLSGGEKQRIAIARAVLSDPPLLILDEATSAVDSETEKRIQEALQNLVRGRTTIAIAHRLATLRHADRLVVLDKGRVVELGTHEELMAKEDGHFARLVNLQQDINRLRTEQHVYE